MVTILVALLVCVVGAVIFLVAGDGKTATRAGQLGLYAFAVGLLVTLECAPGAWAASEGRPPAARLR